MSGRCGAPPHGRLARSPLLARARARQRRPRREREDTVATATAEQQIDIAYPEAGELTLVLRTGPCRVRFTVSDGPSWIAGSYTDPTGVLPLQVVQGPITTIAQSFDLT